MKKFKAVLFAMCLSAVSATVLAQGESRIRCGEIAEAEFTKSGELHEFLLGIEPGTQVDLSLIPIGATLKLHAKFLEPTGNVIWVSNEIYGDLDTKPGHVQNFVGQPRIKTEAISSRGDHKIRVYNWNAGVYSLYLNCVLRSGAQIRAGETIYEPAVSVPPPPMQTVISNGGPEFPQTTIISLPPDVFPPPPADPSSAEQILSQVKVDAGHGDIKTQLKVAALQFAKEQAVGWLAGRLLKSKAGRILNGVVGEQLRGQAPLGLDLSGQGLASGLGPAVAQDLLVAAVSPTVSPAAALALQRAQAVQQAQALQQAQAIQQAQALQQAQAIQQAQALQQAQAVQQAQALQQAQAVQQAARQPEIATLAPAYRSASVETSAVSKTIGAILYAESHFAGSTEVFPASDPNLNDNPIGDNTASSLRILPGCVATLFSEINFKGKGVDVANELVDLGGTPVGNDNVSSIKVRCQG